MDIRKGAHYDVIVFGCGSAGFCAAIQAARSGARVAVVEKYAVPGGVMTVLGNNCVSQFNNPFRAEKKMIIAGIGWEFCRRLEKMGYAEIPDMDAPYTCHWQYDVKVNPVAAALCMTDMLAEAGADVYLDQSLAAAETDGARVTGAVITTAQGLTELTAQVYIDCTGDAALCTLAGADTIVGDGKGNIQPGTMRYYPFVSDPTDPAVSELVEFFGDNRNHITGYNCADSAMKTKGDIQALRTVFDRMEELRRANAPAQIIGIAPSAGARESRRIVGRSCMAIEDYKSGRIFADTVCYSFWFVDVHLDAGGSRIEYLTSGATPALRYSAMVPEKLENVLAAGRCVSTDRDTNSALRVKATCMALGQAAGLAAAIAVRDGIECMADVPADKLRKELSAAGAIVPGMDDFRDFRASMI